MPPRKTTPIEPQIPQSTEKGKALVVPQMAEERGESSTTRGTGRVTPREEEEEIQEIHNQLQDQEDLEATEEEMEEIGRVVLAYLKKKKA